MGLVFAYGKAPSLKQASAILPAPLRPVTFAAVREGSWGIQLSVGGHPSSLLALAFSFSSIPSQ